MKVTLISPYDDVTAFGVRSLSSFLRENGHDTRVILLPPRHGSPERRSREYDDRVLSDVVSLCEGSGMVGISLMTNYLSHAVKLTEVIRKKLDVPIVWGGIHPTIRPEESLDYADWICVGDGEDPLLEFVNTLEQGGDVSQTPSFWHKSNGEIQRNPLAPLRRELDEFPAPDYSFEDHYVAMGTSVQPLTVEIMSRFLFEASSHRHHGGIDYLTMTGRGCPHCCTYCMNDKMRTLYKGQKFFRWRSVQHLIRELEFAKEKMPFIGGILLSDDTFLGRPVAQIREFCKEYKEKIGLPFFCYCSPITSTEEKLGLMVDAGLTEVHMGVESGSPRIQQVFKREKMGNDCVLEAMKVINKFKDRLLPPGYDFITDVPYQTREDGIDNLKLIAEIPKPYRVKPFSLVMFPGTEIHDMAMMDGFIIDDRSEVYEKDFDDLQNNYLNLLLVLTRGGNFPSWLIKLLIRKPVVAALDSQCMKWLIELSFFSLRQFIRATHLFMRLGKLRHVKAPVAVEAG